MERLKAEIVGMSCGHCVAAVRKALAKVPGLSVVDVAIGSATVEVESSAATAPLAKRVLEDAGYQVTGVTPVALASAAPQSGGACCCGGGKCS